MMPKNSRRKKASGQRAVRKGERYMRAWRSTGTTAQRAHQDPPALAQVKVDHIALDFEKIHRVQRVVELRGWVIFDDHDLDAHGLVRTWEPLFDYVPAFGGIELPDEDEDVVPLKPTCRFSWDRPTGPTDDGWIVVDTAGNAKGCEQHRTHEHRLPLTEAGIAELPRLLAEVEAPARALDAIPFLECLADGPCAEQWRQRRDSGSSDENAQYVRQLIDDLRGRSGNATPQATP